jgi:Base plate wedge protein 53
VKSYFETFPDVIYNDRPSKNILSRSAITSSALDKYGVFYPYRVRDHERPDTIAFDYYGDSKYVWLVLMANDMVDPYHDWPLNDDNFKSFIIQKYGSVRNAMSSIDHYVINDKYVSLDSFSVIYGNPPVLASGTVAKYAWDVELELNEGRKEIKLLSKQYAQRAYDELKGSYVDDRS